MIDFLSLPGQSWSPMLIGWLLTYLLHSTVFLGGAWLLTRLAALSLGNRELVWKLALVGGIATSLVQVGTGVGLSTFELTGGPDNGTQARRVVTTAPLESTTLPLSSASEMSESANVPNVLEAAESQNASSTNAEGSILALMEWMSLAIVGWLAIGLLLLIYRGLQTWSYFRRISPREPADSPHLNDMLARVKQQAGVDRYVRLTVSDRLSSPAAVGTREICLPAGMVDELSGDQVMSLLAHELAHLEYRDPVWLLGLTLVESLLFVQPLNYLASVRLCDLFEERSDRWAVHCTGRAKPLAEVLLQLATDAVRPARLRAVSSMAVSRSSLSDRIRRLSSTRGGTFMEHPNWKYWIGAFALLGVVACATPQVVVEDSTAPPPPEPPVPAVQQQSVPPPAIDSLDAQPPAVPVPKDSSVAAVSSPPPAAPEDPDSLDALREELRELQQQMQEKTHELQQEMQALRQKHQELMQKYLREQHEHVRRQQFEHLRELEDAFPKDLDSLHSHLRGHLQNNLDSIIVHGPNFPERFDSLFFKRPDGLERFDFRNHLADSLKQSQFPREFREQLERQRDEYEEHRKNLEREMREQFERFEDDDTTSSRRHLSEHLYD